ncbi:MAG: hypothetical protein IJN83_07895 [Clostridia bacterium]|nr:hypothetical protein [Clostridia bacterium]
MEKDIELIIKRVAEEVYAMVRAEAQNGAASVGSSSGEWMFAKMQTSLTLAEVQQACAQVKGSKAKTICLPQWFVAPAVEMLKGSGVKVATVVGLPGGTTSSFAKYAEVKQAVVAGAETVLIPVNMTLCAMSEWGTAKNDLADSMVPCKGKAECCAVVEVDSLSCDQLEMAADMCASCGVDMVMLSAVVGGSVTDAQVQAVKKKGVRVGVYGGVNQANVNAYQQAGATCFVSSSC